MNERIREVWIKAAREDSDPNNWDTQEQFIERFAKLIVNECCQRLLKEDIRYGGYGYNQYGLHNKLREHFGVEE